MPNFYNLNNSRIDLIGPSGWEPEVIKLSEVGYFKEILLCER